MAEEGAVVAPLPPACRAAVVSGLFVGPWIELLAVRTGPGVEHPILDRLGDGYPLQVCAREGEWFAIVEADFTIGTPLEPSSAGSRNSRLQVRLGSPGSILDRRLFNPLQERHDGREDAGPPRVPVKERKVTGRG